MSLTPNILNYLKKRGISDEVARENNLDWQGANIVIPVYDIEGNFLFNKYRRSPWSEEGPKYRYDKGAHTALYHYDKIKKQHGPIIFCEGEFDALSLETQGFNSITSTGGASAFETSWPSLLNGREVVLCFDNDDAGRRGMVNALAHLGKAYIILLPKEFNDVTDFFLEKSHDDFVTLVADAISFEIPQVRDDPETRKQGKMMEKEINYTITNLVELRRDMKNQRKDESFVNMVIAYLNNRSDAIKARFSQRGRPLKDIEGVARAKSYPITSLLKFDKYGFACCPFHNEANPSVKYYKARNGGYCFGCNKNMDSIDVVMQLEGLTFKAAVEKLQ